MVGSSPADGLSPSAARWHAAITRRHSSRCYDGRPLAATTVATLTAACADFRPFPGVRAVFVNEAPDDVLSGIVGSLGRIRGAPGYLAFIATGDDPLLPAQLGYVGEAMVLEATAHDLGTCWVGGQFHQAAVHSRLELGPDEHALALATVGHPTLSALDLFVQAITRPNRRKPLVDIFAGELTTAWQHVALTAAQQAPSAANRQPWLFRVGGDQVICTVHGGIGRFTRIDCGIAMLHFDLGARHAGVVGQWEWLAGKEVGRFTV